MQIDPESLRRLLHDKIERMDGLQISMLHRILLQLEAETLAERLGENFSKDCDLGLLRLIPQLVNEFRATHPYR